ncbi:polysaccharide deacetylase family protein [Solirubrobacter ginsenosidimutans]|uniref:Polysaccharide deacetylase family protein n=1 Tax=Solirubrobacter ginsenosidimutans TaxID=490573 RepID=A0A9X3MTM6_9ACTN|nr:polysaccharide deacetylase family protein [Solirubrobacter ginsenosidimutans]MDA0161636.1 polysaccharide deacetylase family protein [Solirubrobacter ginsenosidimutans]
MRVALAAGTVAAGAWTVPALAPLTPLVSRPLAIRTTIERGVALTFDDGPHPQGTPAILEILAAANVHATFFLVGEQVLRSPTVAAEIVAAGHAVAVHGHRHRNLLRISPAGVASDLDRAHAVIADVTGQAANVHRPPYGIYSWPALNNVRARGWTPTLWSRWGRDWTRRATAHSIASTVADGVRDGDVLLLHDADDYSAPGSWRATAAALPRVLEAVASAGLDFAQLD